MITRFFTWWYSDGLIDAWQRLLGIINGVIDFFSVDTLIKTWAAPWKNDVQAARNIALQDQVKLWEENFASRVVGLLIRSAVIFVAIVVIGVVAIFGFGLLVIWLLTPFLIIALPIWGLLL